MLDLAQLNLCQASMLGIMIKNIDCKIQNDEESNKAIGISSHLSLLTLKLTILPLGAT